MGKRIIRIGLLPVIVVIALVTNMSSGIAHAASYQDSARAAGSVAASRAKAAVTGSALAPCTTPNTTYLRVRVHHGRGRAAVTAGQVMNFLEAGSERTN